MLSYLPDHLVQANDGNIKVDGKLYRKATENDRMYGFMKIETEQDFKQVKHHIELHPFAELYLDFADGRMMDVFLIEDMKEFRKYRPDAMLMVLSRDVKFANSNPE